MYWKPLKLTAPSKETATADDNMVETTEWRIRPAAGERAIAGVRAAAVSEAADKAITMDLGLKNMAQISTRELANSSSEFKQALLDRMKGGPLEGQPEDLRRAEPIPMSVIVKEDVMRLPIATPVRALSPHSSTRALRIQRHRPAHFACGARRCTRPAWLGK